MVGGNEEKRARLGRRPLPVGRSAAAEEDLGGAVAEVDGLGYAVTAEAGKD